MTEFEKRSRAAWQALKGERTDVYPCREDIPAELWGTPVVNNSKQMFGAPSKHMNKTFKKPSK